jgi:hypothetical protein
LPPPKIIHFEIRYCPLFLTTFITASFPYWACNNDLANVTLGAWISIHVLDFVLLMTILINARYIVMFLSKIPDALSKDCVF